MKLIVTGATGVAGSDVIRQAILRDDVTSIVAIVRKPLAVSHPKVTVVIQSDFTDYSGVAESLRTADAWIWCLGIAQSLVTESEYHRITYDFTMAAARAAVAANPKMTFVFLSGQGADSTETSRILFARVKGKTENALKSVGFKSLIIARPVGIIPTTPKPKPWPWYEYVMFPLYPVVKLVLPWLVISSADLANAMMNLVPGSDGVRVVENRELRRVGRS